jgi:2-dehydro-3-deoxyphosphogluconate aldolase/(4S)-4-hydroxy-2-oxoglutarate aldolase
MSSISQRSASRRDAVPDMADKIELIDNLCARARILPVITIEREEDVLPLADALAAGGLDTLEITLRSEHGLGAIRTLREQRPNLCVGAGTVLDELMLAEAEAAGAQFIVTPGCTAELLRAGVYSPLPLLPGIASASEIMLGYALGYRRFKLFPAEICGGIKALKAFGGPFPGIRFCPTGGVNPGNLRDYMALANVMCVGGTWMMDKEWIRKGDWQRIQECSAEALALLG